MSEKEASTKSGSSSGLPSSSAGSGNSSSGIGASSSQHGSSSNSNNGAETQHSHISSLKTSATSDSAYGGSNTQSQRSGSGSGSRSSKSQISSNSSNNASTEQSKSRTKEKEPGKKRKSKASVPPIHAPSPGGAEAALGTAGLNAAATAASTASALITAASTATANACSSSTVEGGTLAAPGATDGSIANCSGAVTGDANGDRSTGSAGLTMGGTRAKSSRVGCGIRGVTESRAVQAAALSRALDCLKDTGLNTNKGTGKESLNSKATKEGVASPNWHPVLLDPFEDGLKKTFAHLEDVPTVKTKDAFIAAISLQDGVVVYVTPSLTDRLGYPAEMWCGRSLLDFIHPKDRLAFTNQITTRLLASLDKDDTSGYSFNTDDGGLPRGMIGSSSSPPNVLCSRLRMYRGLRTSGFGIVDKKTSYMPFRISLNLEKIRVPSEQSGNADGGDDATASATVQSDDSEYFLLAYAVPISTAYKVPDEKNSTAQFGLRHNNQCLFSEVDMSSVPYLGHLPQDLLGASALDFYHPNDLPELKKVYDSVIGRQGKSIRSKPYNFRAFNGCYVLLETDWTCFVNPWTKKLEFVAGQHHVLKGPSNPDVFASPPEGSQNDLMDQTASDNTKKLQAEICTILNGSAKPPAPQQRSSRVDNSALLETATRRRKNLATLMGSLIEEVVKVRGSHSCSHSCSSGGSHCVRCAKPHLLMHSPVEAGSLLGDASVVMGDISTHGGSIIDSNSADTPLSYSMLNYNQNLERYFQSQPKMMSSDGSGESSGNGKRETPNISSEEESGGLGNTDSSGTTMPSCDSQEQSSSNKSPTNSKSQSNSNSKTQSQSKSNSTGSQNNDMSSTDAEFKGLPLTKEILGRHNEEMEKEFMQQHRDMRNRTSTSRRLACHRKEPHGVKRGQASSWEEGGAHGRNKHPHIDEFCATPHCYQSPANSVAPAGPFHDWASLTGPSVIPTSLLPPFSVSATSPNTHSAIFSMANRNELGNHTLPAYYLAHPGTSTPTRQHPIAIGNAPQFVMTQQPTYSLQPYSYPHGVIYQPVMVPPMLFQPELGMMIPASAAIPQRSTFRPDPRQRLQPDRSYPYAESMRPSTSGVPRHFQLDVQSQLDSLSQARQSFDQQQSERQQQHQRPISRRIPPWMEAVSGSAEMAYQYQLPGRNTLDVLEADRERLSSLQQPVLLNNQLFQLYTEMEAEQREGVNQAVEEGENSTGSSADDTSRRGDLRRRSEEFRRTMLYEENAPFPRPASSTMHQD